MVWFGHQLSQLNQFLGEQRYAPADALLRSFIPPPDPKYFLAEARGAAIWALGKIHEGKKVPELVAPLEARVNDIRSIPPEMFQVRRMSAIVLGRMKAKKALPTLQSFNNGSMRTDDIICNSCGWAIEQITGTSLPLAKPAVIEGRDWFLNRE
jgi:hypothetical protein